jgi:hypothetical protein
MKSSIITLTCLAAVTALTACASASAPQVAEATPAKKCAASLGTHICRDDGANVGNVKTVSGDTLRNGPGTGSGSVQGSIGN